MTEVYDRLLVTATLKMRAFVVAVLVLALCLAVSLTPRMLSSPD